MTDEREVARRQGVLDKSQGVRFRDWTFPASATSAVSRSRPTGCRNHVGSIMTAMTRGTLFRGHDARRLGILFLAVPFIAALATPAAAAAGDDHQLKLKAAIFDPANGLP